ncbi:MAG: DUF2784 domain-containing protein [Gemmatimonadales bacterium]|jgi:hypothetical protein
MTPRLLADAVVLVHLVYILFVLLGALLVRHRPLIALPHLAAVAWGVYVAAMARVCPLTPLEVALRVRAGEAGYHGGFIEHYVLPVLYPGGLTRGILAAEAAGVVVVNVALYAWVWRARRRERPAAR